jgi:hypothetical protein
MLKCAGLSIPRSNLVSGAAPEIVALRPSAQAGARLT